MNKIIALLTLALLPALLPAQTKQEIAVAAAVEKLRVAMIGANTTDLENSVADQLSYGHSSGVIDDKKEFVEKIVSGKSDFVSIDLSEQTIRISGKVAVVRHLFHAKTNDGGRPGEVKIRVLLVWQKQGKDWKLLARQAVRI